LDKRAKLITAGRVPAEIIFPWARLGIFEDLSFEPTPGPGYSEVAMSSRPRKTRSGRRRPVGRVESRLSNRDVKRIQVVGNSGGAEVFENAVNGNLRCMEQPGAEGRSAGTQMTVRQLLTG